MAKSPSRKKDSKKRHHKSDKKESKRRPSVTQRLKLQILEVIRPHYRYLVGTFNRKYTKDKRFKAWKEIWKSVKHLPDVKKSLPHEKTLRDRFWQWKGTVKSKITQEGATGECPANWTESDKVFWNLLKESNECGGVTVSLY